MDIYMLSQIGVLHPKAEVSCKNKLKIIIAILREDIMHIVKMKKARAKYHK